MPGDDQRILSDTTNAIQTGRQPPGTSRANTGSTTDTFLTARTTLAQASRNSAWDRVRNRVSGISLLRHHPVTSDTPETPGASRFTSLARSGEPLAGWELSLAEPFETDLAVPRSGADGDEPGALRAEGSTKPPSGWDPLGNDLARTGLHIAGGGHLRPEGWSTGGGLLTSDHEIDRQPSPAYSLRPSFEDRTSLDGRALSDFIGDERITQQVLEDRELARQLATEEAVAVQANDGPSIMETLEDRELAQKAQKDEDQQYYNSQPTHKWLYKTVWAHGLRGEFLSGLRRDGRIVHFEREWDFWSEPENGYGIPSGVGETDYVLPKRGHRYSSHQYKRERDRREAVWRDKQESEENPDDPAEQSSSPLVQGSRATRRLKDALKKLDLRGTARDSGGH